MIVIVDHAAGKGGAQGTSDAFSPRARPSSGKDFFGQGVSATD